MTPQSRVLWQSCWPLPSVCPDQLGDRLHVYDRSSCGHSLFTFLSGRPPRQFNAQQGRFICAGTWGDGCRQD
eukprot:216106-Pleurochrysis_carterae.AAC.1